MSLRVRLLLLHPAKAQAVCSLRQEGHHSIRPVTPCDLQAAED